MSLETVFEVLWGGEIGCIAILFELFQSYKDKYYLGVNVNKVLFKQLHLGISLLVLVILNIVVLFLVTIPVNQVTILQIYLSFFIILLC